MLSPVPVIRDVNKKPEFNGGLPSGLDMFMKPGLTKLGTNLFVKWFAVNFLKHRPSRKILMILYGHTSLQLSFTTSDCC
jgi:hypothetical protein